MHRLRVNWRVSLRLLGGVLKWLAVPLAIPLVVAVIDGDPLVPFLAPIAVTLAAGVGLEQLETEKNMYTREAYLMVSLSWLCVGLVGAIPFVLAGNGLLAAPSNAIFESMSGITTTGATIIDDFGAHSRSILLWRQVIQWLGGLGILVLAISILSQLSVGGAQLMETESQTQDVQKLTPKIAGTARLIWRLYAGITLLATGGLFALGVAGIAPGMDLFNAVSHAMTAVATAGFSPQPDSVGAFAPAAQWLLVPFMFIGATNFILLYFFVNGDWGRPLRNEEFRFYLALVVGASVLMTLLLLVDADVATGGLEETVRVATFQIVSLLTTTGFATVDFNTWSPAAKHLLFACMFLGGMAGSTTCSIKLLRWLIVLKAFRRDLFTTIHPEAITPVRLSGTAVDEATIRDIYAYTLLSLVIFALATLVVVIDSARVGLELSEFEAMSAAAATFFNIGPAFGIAGPFNSYSPFSTVTKAAMTLLMYVGRIEIIPVAVLFTRSFWQS
ncbi:TrkH family potassium uptake protein [Halonotius aquaticus]|uniref:TrkH family potassium uptake protein n=1 Tax=Halonotius aquaticus TaxID=2216978 RepID=A0A3A6PQZ1_9EURY|nr:TrkH family potassium uptake protein [Halonotius aquaticus]RJX44201.1 TrkH family potassium uptake protein [Halonotius aquaticus]